MSGTSFQPGQHVGDYEIVSTLGKGGLGAVYEVRHLISNRSEAIKVLLLDHLGTPDLHERFRREIQMLASLSHPHIAALHNAFYHGDQLVMVMELVRGETLRVRSSRSELNLTEVISIATQTLSALSYAHTNGIVHRDIKPSNLMVTGGDQVKILDFGIALAQHGADLTTAGSLIGSLHYMSPEQISGNRATPQSDIYSLGVTLYELVTGHLPFIGATSYEIMNGHMHERPKPPVDWNPALPPSFSDAILTALAKAEHDRFSSVQSFSSALNASLIADAYTITMPIAVAPSSGLRRSSAAAGSRPSASGSRAPSPLTPTPSRSTPQPGSLAAAQPHTTPQLDAVARSLAAYIGPIAKVVVRRLANHCNGIDQLYAEASLEIGDPAQRDRFLLDRRSSRPS